MEGGTTITWLKANYVALGVGLAVGVVSCSFLYAMNMPILLSSGVGARFAVLVINGLEQRC